ncbi:MAG: hypothetical protein FJ279_16665 [Planctomycetes bacterium]|nr:hypothetical protein [Planctomycetota bacterium]MBM4086488.1 hypothetical protein [Planctomycetota bacterium]
MRSLQDIRELLDELDHQPADAMEAQDLDLKEWNVRSMSDSVSLVVEMAVCMANGGGGTVVFGVNDKAVGRSNAILGVPNEVDVNRLMKAVYDSTDPKLTPVFEELSNADIRRITHFNRNQVFRMMQELIQEEIGVVLTGQRKSARYVLKQT